jgi:Kef-type K+ transport system membrane component KefB
MYYMATEVSLVDKLPSIEFYLVLALFIFAANGSGWLSVRLGQPAVLGELLAGILLGPTVLNVMGWEPIHGPALRDTVFLLGELGAVMLLFLAGLHTDVGDLRRVGGAATLVATLGVLVPILGGIALSPLFGLDPLTAIFIGIILAATSVSITVRTLMELGVLRSLAGLTILAAAVVDDVEALVILSLFTAFTTGVEGIGSVGWVVFKLIAYFAVAIVVGRLAFSHITRWVAKSGLGEGAVAVGMLIALIYAWSAEHFAGIAAITGAYLAGVLLTNTELHSIIENKTRTITYGIFVPIFFITIGLSVNLRSLDLKDLGLLLAILAIAAVSKVAGCGVGALIYRYKRREALQVGLGMMSRGEVGLIVASIGLAKGLIAQDIFSVTVIMVLATTVVTPPLLRLAFPRVHASGEHTASARV